MHLSAFLYFITPCFFPLQVLMSVVLHYAVPPGFNLASGEVGLTPRLWSPSAYYSLSLVGEPEWVQAGWMLGGSCSVRRVDVVVVFVDVLVMEVN